MVVAVALDRATLAPAQLTQDRVMLVPGTEHMGLLASETRPCHTLVSVMVQFHMVIQRKLAGQKLAVEARYTTMRAPDHR